MKRRLVGLWAVFLVAVPAGASAQQSPFTLDQVLGITFPDNLVAAPSGQRIAYTIQQRGGRSIWVAEGPDFTPRRLTGYPDDGQEITSLQFVGPKLVYARGGDHGSNWDNPTQPDPTSMPVEPRIEIWAIGLDGGQPVKLAEGDDPVASPSGDRVVFSHGHELWVVPSDASQPAKRLFFARGNSQSPVWSPDGSRLAFVSNRGDYSFIAIYVNDSTPLQYLAPSTNRDGMPRWSPDGTRIAFVRQFGRGGPAQNLLEQIPQPWSIWVAEASSGEGHVVWKSPETLRGSLPRTEGGPNLNWAAGDRLVFLADMDNWPHLYSVPVTGGDPLLLTPGEFMVEYVAMTPDRRSVVYNANTGSTKDDSERRHLFRVPVDQAKPAALTSGMTLEWAPVVTADGSTLAYVAADATQPPLPYVRPLSGGQPKALNRDLIAADFPADQLVVPEHVTWQSPDGLTIHGQLFKPSDKSGGTTRSARPARSPAVVFVHGGPPRQMLLGWHYMYYYANSYAVNQYLASRGYVVLSVNYRLGIGYGHDFHNPPHAGARGAAEYQDVLAGGKYLQSRPDVDPNQIGIWGGSYGGFLVAMALGRNSDVFAAGVDFHGVHDRTQTPPDAMQLKAQVGDGISEKDLADLLRVEWESSPDAYVGTWKSPVLLIQGDDDRNVHFEETVELAQRLRKQGVSFEEMVLPDEIHDFLLFRNWARGDSATAAFLDKMLKPRPATR
jgi:dipeptidyl aminopeptidase/acylaminoacyl peptidase